MTIGSGGDAGLRDVHVRQLLEGVADPGVDGAGLPLVGDGPAVADLALFACTHRADEGGFALGEWPGVAAWVRRVEGLPGVTTFAEGGRCVMTPLRLLEAESIEILREAAAECRAPVLLYSVGKDSGVLLHLALKAFRPGPLPFPLLHIDTGWKFREMIAHRDEMVRRLGVELVVHTHPDRLNPFDHGAQYTRVMKTEALRQALDAGGFRTAFGGARRDEERSRAKERVFSVRGPGGVWDPRRQRPEFWRVYNGMAAPDGEMRVFPLSNWTEADVWDYVAEEAIPVVPLYFAQELPVVERDGSLIVVHDARMRLRAGERPVMRRVRFRSLGCYPLTGAVESSAATVEEVRAELAGTRVSERGGRLIDRDEAASMERKKREGYF